MEEVHDLFDVLLDLTESSRTNANLHDVVARMDLDRLQRAEEHVQFQEESLVLPVDELMQLLAVGDGGDQHVAEVYVRADTNANRSCRDSEVCPRR